MLTDEPLSYFCQAGRRLFERIDRHQFCFVNGKILESGYKINLKNLDTKY